ncbi:MAG: DUF1819 family protein [Chloroflexi bacterium]|nr:DUF1819 family protein [Chloroflexota bacterium]
MATASAAIPVGPCLSRVPVFPRRYASYSEPERGLLCFLLVARTERLFRELTLTCVSPLLGKPGSVVEAAAVDAFITDVLARHALTWTEETRVTARQHAVSALKDFGLLEGGPQKRTRRVRPGTESTLFATRLAQLEGLTDRQVLESRWFRLLGLSPGQAVDLLYAAGRSGALGFRMQADVVELTMPPVEAL